jgi:hypothetical protein
MLASTDTSASMASVRWKNISSARRDGKTVTLGWLPNGIVEHEVRSRWVNGRWEGGWTPTHWHA